MPPKITPTAIVLVAIITLKLLGTQGNTNIVETSKQLIK